MILPSGVDLEKPDDELVEDLVASGRYSRAEAEDLAAILRSDEPVD